MSRTGWGHLEFDLWHISYIIGGRNPKFSVWIHLGLVECHTLFIYHCVSFMKIYCLWGYFINLWHYSWFCLIINSQTEQFKGIFIGSTTFFSNRRKDWIVPNQYLHFLSQRSTYTAWYRGKQTLYLPKVASLYLMTVPVFELPGTTSNMYFVHMNLMNSVENTEIQKCIKDRLDLL